MTERYVVLGLAPARSSWFRAVAQWATAGTVGCEFIKCVSGEELRARVATGRVFSAALVDAAMPTVDRDLIVEVRAAGCPVLIVDDGRVRRDWRAVGAAAVLPSYLDPALLSAALSTHAIPVGGAEPLPGDGAVNGPPLTVRATVAAVCGAGGTGASTAAIALAQGLATGDQSVLLADLARHADQAMLHDARDVIPGVQELVEAHRAGALRPEELRDLTFAVEERGYDLLLGLRRARAWSALRPRAFAAAFAALRTAYDVIVCDTDDDVEGEGDGGSLDVEERNVMARTAVGSADVVFVVGRPSMKGIHSLVRVVHDVRAVSRPATPIVPVVNSGPRSPRARAELARALGLLLPPSVPSPIFLPDRPVDAALRDGVPLPVGLATPLAAAFTGLATRPPATPEPSPPPVVAGSLGTWAEEVVG